jgi:hypothetical protein
MSKKNEKDSSRRDFLKKGFSIAAGTILGGGVLASCSKDPGPQGTG